MNAITHLPQPAVIDAETPASAPDNIYAQSFTPSRYDGWTPERQKTFLEAISEGHTIKHACRIVGLSPQSAYAFRRRPQGAAFSLAWQAACLLTRDEFADELMERARNGVTETITYRDGTSVERQRFDNRLGTSLLARLDRLADRAAGDVGHAAARLVAAEFDAFLDLLGRGPARAGLFLGARAQEATEADLAPIRALARADRWLRTHTSLAEEVDVSDLDPAQRAEWTAGQWARAEAAGLLALAPQPKPEPTPPPSQVHQPNEPEEQRDPPLWWDCVSVQWRTRYPAPPGFHGEERGEYGEFGYWRALSPEEEEVIEAPRRAERAERARIEAIERDELFGFTPAKVSPPPPGDGPTQSDLAAAIPVILAALDAEGDWIEAGDGPEDDDENWDYAQDDAWFANAPPSPCPHAGSAGSAETDDGGGSA